MTAAPTVPLILDTDVLIEIVKGGPKAQAWFISLPGVPHVCGFVAMELLYGARDGQELRRLQKYLQMFPIVWPSEPDLQRALEHYMMLPLAHGIGLLDLLIATTAVGTGLKLMTFNAKHFCHVPGLDYASPYVL